MSEFYTKYQSVREVGVSDTQNFPNTRYKSHIAFRPIIEESLSKEVSDSFS